MLEKNEILQILNYNYNISFIDADFNRDGGSISYVVTSDEKRYF